MAAPLTELDSAAGVQPQMRIDITPPTLGAAYVTMPCNFTNATCRENKQMGSEFISDGVIVQASWQSARDDESAVTTYAACAGSKAYECDLHATVENVSITAIQFELGTPLEHNQTVCVSVTGSNEVGLTSDRIGSNCAEVDATPPKCEFVKVGLGLDNNVTEQSFTDLIFGQVRSRPFHPPSMPSMPFHALPCPSMPFHALPCPSMPFHGLPHALG